MASVPGAFSPFFEAMLRVVLGGRLLLRELVRGGLAVLFPIETLFLHGVPDTYLRAR